MPRNNTSADRILASAQKLILSKGFTATTIDEVCEAAGVTKGGLYYHFKSKEQLAMALIDFYFDRIATALGSTEASTEDTPLARVVGFLDRAREAVEGPMLKDGCVLGALALDLAETHEAIRKVISARFAGLAAGLEKDLAAALAEIQPSQPVSAAGLARQFFAVLEGSIILSKAHNDPQLLVEGLEHYRFGLLALLQPQH